MNIKDWRLPLRVGLCIVAGSAGVFVAYPATPQTAGARQFMRPFVAELVEEHFDEKGNLAPLPAGIDYITVGRRSDGSQVRFLPIQEPDGSFTLMRDVFDVSGKTLAIYPSIQSVTTDYFQANDVGHHIANFESCPPEAYSPAAQRSRRLGYEVVQILADHSDKKGVEHDERWVAPGLACFTLSEKYTSEFGAHNETEVIGLFEGEPPESWFRAPTDYVERSPSEVAAAYAARFPGHKFATDEAAAMMDKRYYAHRPAASGLE